MNRLCFLFFSGPTFLLCSPPPRQWYQQHVFRCCVITAALPCQAKSHLFAANKAGAILSTFLVKAFSRLVPFLKRLFIFSAVCLCSAMLASLRSLWLSGAVSASQHSERHDNWETQWIDSLATALIITFYLFQWFVVVAILQLLNLCHFSDSGTSSLRLSMLQPKACLFFDNKRFQRPKKYCLFNIIPAITLAMSVLLMGDLVKYCTSTCGCWIKDATHSEIPFHSAESHIPSALLSPPVKSCMSVRCGWITPYLIKPHFPTDLPLDFLFRQNSV